MTSGDIVHIGCAAGFSGDRFDASLPIVADMAARTGPKFLMFEVLAERTLALAQGQKRAGMHEGYSPYLDNYIRPVLAQAMAGGVRIVSNMGAANPRAAAKRVHAIAAEYGLAPPRIFVVTGDDLTARMSEAEILAAPTMEGNDLGGRPLIAANAYLGAQPIAEAVQRGADIILVGRTTDSALALGPLIAMHGWKEDDWDRLASGTIAGHLLECGGQVTGAYFADPGFKDVPDLAHVGFPIAEVDGQGRIVMTKPAGTGGLVSRATVTEQLLYEMHDPAAYLTPDVTADVTALTLGDDGPDRIAVDGIVGRAPPATYKATVCVDNGWLGEAEISYAGPNALARTELAAAIVQERMRMHGITDDLRFDVIGSGSVFNGGHSQRKSRVSDRFDAEYRLRAAMLSEQRQHAQTLIDEVQSLYCSGPAAGGGIRFHLTPQVATASIKVARERIEPAISVEEVTP